MGFQVPVLIGMGTFLYAIGCFKKGDVNEKIRA